MMSNNVDGQFGLNASQRSETAGARYLNKIKLYEPVPLLMCSSRWQHESAECIEFVITSLYNSPDQL
jgi:hypothetical protein